MLNTLILLSHTFSNKFLFFLQATLYSLKSLNDNRTKVASYDKLKAEFNEAIREKARLDG